MQRGPAPRRRAARRVLQYVPSTYATQEAAKNGSETSAAADAEAFNRKVKAAQEEASICSGIEKAQEERGWKQEEAAGVGLPWLLPKL